MLKIRRMWERGRGGIHFNNIFSIFVETMCHPKLVSVRKFCVVIAYFMCRVCWPRSQGSHWDLRHPAPNLGWHMTAAKIQKILLKWLPRHPHFHKRLMFNFNILSVIKCCKYYHF